MVHVIICDPIDFLKELSKYIEELPYPHRYLHRHVELLAVCRLENGVAHYVIIR